MPFGLISDDFYDHPKSVDLPDSAVCLWARALSYCMRHLTDGLISDRQARRLCDNPEEAIKHLTESGLWDREDGGYRFHDIADYNPSRETVLARRADNANRQQAFRDRRKAAKEAAAQAASQRDNAVRNSDTTGVTGRIDNPVGNGASNVERNALRNGGVTLSPTPTPTPTPAPTPTTREEVQNPLAPATRRPGNDDGAVAIPGTEIALPAPSSVKNRRGTRVPEDFVPSEATREWARTNYAAVDARTEHMKFMNYWLAKTGKDATKLDWDRTWQNWITTAAERSGIRRGAAAPVTDDGRRVHAKTSAHLDHLAAYGDPDA